MSVKDQGSFFGAESGNERKPGRRSPKKTLIVLIVLVAVLFPAGYLGLSKLYGNFLEATAPKIEIISKLPLGMGQEPSTLVFEVSDEESGIDEIVVRAEQNRQLYQLFKQRYRDAVTHKERVSIQLMGRESQFVEGDFHLYINAFDRSFWSNGHESVLTVRVDYRKPHISLLSQQHNMTQGGVGMVFYRVKDNEDTINGMKMGSWWFPGFPAKDLDEAFKDKTDVYFANFPIPLGVDYKESVPMLKALDLVGNLSTLGIPHKVRPLSQRKQQVKLNDDFLMSRVDEVYEKYLIDQNAISGGNERFVSAKDLEESRERFRIVNEEYRKLIETELLDQTFFSRPTNRKLWEEKFGWPASGRRMASFGDIISYTSGGEVISTGVSQGVDIAASEGTLVQATNKGRVIYADELGPYGKTVILDHGFGLSTLYANLLTISVAEGDRLIKGAILGNSGRTGLVDKPNLHFEVRMHGVPVRPEEWWDETWIKGHIINKINAVKKDLGIKVWREVAKNLEPLS